MSFAIGAKKITTSLRPVQLPDQDVDTSGCFLWAHYQNRDNIYLSTASDLPNEEERLTLRPGEGKRLFPSNLNVIYVTVLAGGILWNGRLISFV